MQGTKVPFLHPLNICLDRSFAVVYNPTYSRLVVQSMPQYEQKTDRPQFEVATPDQSPETDLVVRLWNPERSGRAASVSWNTESVLVYMIADLVSASHGRIAEELPTIMGAHFADSRQAIVAAKRIQTSMLEFLSCRPGERIGAAILLYRSKTSDSAGFSAITAQQALRQAKPGQILLAQNISQRLRDLPGVEFRSVPALATAIGDGQTEMTELVWTTPERMALFQDSFGDEAEPQCSEIPAVGATVIVHSPLARGGQTSEPVPTAVVAPPLEELRESSGNSAELRLDEFALRPFLTRTRLIVGVVAVFLVVALFAVLNRPVNVSKLPIPVQQVQAGERETPEKQLAVKAEPEATAMQPESKIVIPEIVTPENVKPRSLKPPMIKSAVKSPVGAQSQIPDKASVDNRVRKDVSETPTVSYEESGGVSQKEIPILLKMAQADAGAGNYDKARIEFRKILGLQPGNQDAKEGLHKLDLIQK
jgi:hypothetical protein